MGQGDQHLMTVEPCFEFFDDFFDFPSDRWLTRQCGGVGGTAALVNASDVLIRGGVLALSVSATDNHKIGIKLGGDTDNGAAWVITKDSGKQLWYTTGFSMTQLLIEINKEADCGTRKTVQQGTITKSPRPGRQHK